MLSNLAFALAVTAPTFLLICLGIFLKRVGIITNEFAQIGSDLVFKVTLPCMLFVKLIQVNFDAPPLALVIYALAATFITFLILELVIAPRLEQADRSAFVQGAFRSNMGIIGLAYCINAYGDGVLVSVSIYLAFVTILYNILSLLTLTKHQLNPHQAPTLRRTLLEISRNPLILSIIISLTLSLVSFKPPHFLLESMDYIGSMSMPLALLCIGASIRWRDFRVSTNLYWATLAKLLLVPGVITLGGIAVGLRGESLGVLYLMSAAPSATAGYAMLRAMGGNHYLGAAIIATTSLGSVIAITLGLFTLRIYDLI
ncbi:MAG: AEC family transporter [Leucothrix sp.]